jgi:hypothetical protein
VLIGEITSEKMFICRVLAGTREGKGTLGTSQRRWEDNIKMDLKETGQGDDERIKLGPDEEK